MAFWIYDVIFLALFTIFIVWFLIKNKKGVEREGILYIYRTKIGMKLINYLGGKYKKLLDFMSYFIIIVGYILMIFFTWYLIKVVYVYAIYPQIMELFDAPPLMLLIPYFPQIFGVTEFFPNFYFTYFLVAIAIVAIAHEGFHGIYMKRYGVKIKSTGFGFLGPILAFFVEQDEKDMKKKPIFQQMVILAAGVFANLIVGVIFLGILFLFFTSFYAPYGVMIAGYQTTNIHTQEIEEFSLLNEELQVNGNKLSKVRINEGYYYTTEKVLELSLDEIKEYDYLPVYLDLPAIRENIKGTIIEVEDKRVKSIEDVNNELKKYEVGDKINIKTDYQGEIKEYNFNLGESPLNGGPIMGVNIGSENPLMIFALMDRLVREEGVDYRTEKYNDFMDFIYILIEWVILINILVALFNMLPIGIFDGGRFFYLSVLAITKNEKVAQNAFKGSTIIFLLMFVGLMLIWVLRKFIFPLF